MSTLERVLEQLGGAAHAELVEERLDLLRFGRSRITYQHSEDRVTLRARIIRDGRAVWGTLGTTAPAAVAALSRRLEAHARALPPGDPAPLAPPTASRPAATAFGDAGPAGDEARIALFREAAGSLPERATLGGSVLHSTTRHAVANTAGTRREERRTRAAIQVIGTLDGRSSWARVVARDAAQIAAPDIRAGLAARPARDIRPGRFRAVLAPQAVVTLLATLGHVAFAEGAPGSVADRLGKRLFSPLLSVADDGCDEDGLPSTFDCEGVAKARVALVENGVARGVVTHRTGHSAPPGWRFGAGPAASHLAMAPGSLEEEQLLQACERGLYLQRIDYVRVVQPRQMLVTGSSRDATLWVEGGEIAARLPQFRFTLRLDELFDALLAVGRRRERGDTVFMESVVAPGAVVDGFPVDLVTGG